VSKGQNIRTLNPALKTMTTFNRKRMILLYGVDSEQAKGAQELLNDMCFGNFFPSSQAKGQN
jgi:hypothetical protein